jgi:hypothetical protein
VKVKVGDDRTRSCGQGLEASLGSGSPLSPDAPKKSLKQEDGRPKQTQLAVVKVNSLLEQGARSCQAVRGNSVGTRWRKTRTTLLEQIDFLEKEAKAAQDNVKFSKAKLTIL